MLVEMAKGKLEAKGNIKQTKTSKIIAEVKIGKYLKLKRNTGQKPIKGAKQ